jgi:hypothetical protein
VRAVGDADGMAAGHDAHDSHGHDDHGHDAHDDHGHDSHGSGGDFWVVPPLVIGLIIGLIIVVVFGLQSGAPAFG